MGHLDARGGRVQAGAIIHDSGGEHLMSVAQKITVHAHRLGAIVERMRNERRWTIEELARRSDLNSIYLGRVERGLNLPSIITLFRLAEAFGVSAADLIRELEGAIRRPRRAQEPPA
jgi:DNA-binding XRE family transcriptional regulator